jgi:hypothetical protein
MKIRSDWLAIPALPFIGAIPDGVKMTALGLREGVSSERFWVGPPLLVLGIIGLEFVHRWVDPQIPKIFRVLEAVVLVLLFVLTVLNFAVLLDGHQHLRACVWLLMIFVAGATIVPDFGWNSISWGSCYLRWGWAILLAFGLPLALPTLLKFGLIPLC